MINVELLELCRTHRPLPTYVVDETLKQHGHTTIRMPPYHAELNSIKLIWAMLKGKVAMSNLALKKKDVKKLTEDAFESISPDSNASSDSFLRLSSLTPGLTWLLFPLA